MPVLPFRLQHADDTGRDGNTAGVRLAGQEHLVSVDPAPQGADRLLLLIGRHQFRPFQHILLHHPESIILRQDFPFSHMDPGLRDDRVLVKPPVADIPILALPTFKGLGIGLFHHSKAAEFPFPVVVIAIPVAVGRDEPPGGYQVEGLGLRQAVDREAETGFPSLTTGLVFQIEFRGRGILHPDLLAQGIGIARQKIGFSAFH